jgi:hypothetical protein
MFPSRPLLVLPLFPMLACLAWSFSLGVEHLGNSGPIIEDDLFYYFKIAEIAADGNGFSFDGITQTSGFHLLWQVTLIPLAMMTNVVGSDWGMFVSALVLNAVILSASAVIYAKLLARAVGPLVGSLAVGLVYVLLFPLLFNGMETALTLFCISVAILLSQSLHSDLWWGKEGQLIAAVVAFIP